MPTAQSNSLYINKPFDWAVGIEDTFITDPWPATGRILDEYALTDHYNQWRSDFDLAASLGVKSMRYGLPWHIINPAQDIWDWGFADQTLNYLLDIGIDPIVDLVHYGTPAWIEGGFINPNYPLYVAEYARRLAERFQGRIHRYTPLNEPRITAWYCGYLGWWPPHQRGNRGFLRVLQSICRGIVLTMNALRSVDINNKIVAVDATDLYTPAPHHPELLEEAQRRQNVVFLALDLILGRVGCQHPLYSWLVRNGISDDDLAWFETHRVEIDICGINLYPMFSQKILSRDRRGLRIRMPYSSAEIVYDLSKLYHERYQLPIMITETASRGTLARRQAWLKDTLQIVKQTRLMGIPLIGYTWWSMFSMVAWAYRQGAKEPSAYLEHMGLWDLVETNGILERVETPLAEQFREIVKQRI